jgi:hypothetical protein
MSDGLGGAAPVRRAEVIGGSGLGTCYFTSQVASAFQRMSTRATRRLAESAT